MSPDGSASRTTNLQERQAHKNPRGRLPNFDLLRLLAAASVIFSHSFLLVNGDDSAEPLVRLLGPNNILGVYGVYTFFIISGFLITASFNKSSLRDYLAKRCLRILPGLFVCALVTTGAAVLWTSPRLIAWRDQKQSVIYFLKTILLLNTSGYSLPGVVFSSNQFGRFINGSLWTLQPEFLCYLAVAVLGLAAMLRLPVALALLAVGLYTHVTGALGNIGFFIPYFAAGSALYLWKKRPGPNRPAVALAVTGLVLLAFLGYPWVGFALFGAWLLIAFATGPAQLSGATRLGDLSYGMYLYGWPIEQTFVAWLGPGATWWRVFALSLPVACIAAFLSWHLIEAPCLRLADRRVSR